MRANPVYLEQGATVIPNGEDGVRYIFNEPLYAIPEPAYRALMMTE